MTKIISILIGLIVVIAVGGLVYWQTQSEPVETPTPGFGTIIDSSQSGSATPPADTENGDDTNEDSEEASGSGSAGGTGSTGTSGITAAQVAEHKTRSSCWSSINGNVYDLTSWIPKHPGGEQAILKLCGTDGTAAFNRQHGGAAKQAAVLMGFKIGTLTK